MSNCDNTNFKEVYNLIFCDTRDCKISNSLNKNENYIKDNYMKIFLEGHYSNIYCLEPVNVIIPHNMIPFRVIAPEVEWVTYQDADWVDSEKEGTVTPWGPSSPESCSLTWAGHFKLSNFANKSFYDIPILAFAYYDGPFAMPKKIRDYIIENEYFQRALLHPFEMIDTNTYSTSQGYKDLSLVNPVTLKYVIHTSQAYSGVPPIINQILTDATFKDSLSENSISFTSMLLSWAEFVSNNIKSVSILLLLSIIILFFLYFRKIQAKNPGTPILL